MYPKNGNQCQNTKPKTPFPKRKDYIIINLTLVRV